MIPLHDDNPTEITPILTIAFIVACTLVFLYQVSLPEESGRLFILRYGAIPAAVFVREMALRGMRVEAKQEDAG